MQIGIAVGGHILINLKLGVQTVLGIIRRRSISMRAGPAFLQFDWSKADLSKDLPVFVYSHTKTSFRFL